MTISFSLPFVYYSLTHNSIGDEGAIALSDVFKTMVNLEVLEYVNKSNNYYTWLETLHVMSIVVTLMCINLAH